MALTRKKPPKVTVTGIELDVSKWHCCVHLDKPLTVEEESYIVEDIWVPARKEDPSIPKTVTMIVLTPRRTITFMVDSRHAEGELDDLLRGAVSKLLNALDGEGLLRPTIAEVRGMLPAVRAIAEQLSGMLRHEPG